LPWMRLHDEIGIEIVYTSLDSDFRLDFRALDVDFSKVKLVALTHASNVLGTINPISDIVKYFRSKNPAIRVLVDAAQTAGHLPLNVRELDVDFLAFSGHKMFGPSGVGVLYASADVLNEMAPYQLGGQMISSVSKDNVVWAEPPHKFEAGSQNVEGVIGLGAAIDYVQSIGFDQITSHNAELVTYGLEKLTGVTIYGPKTAENRLPIFSFNVEGVHSHDSAEILNRSNIAVRAGHHCAEPLMRCMGVNGTVRASLHIYNNKDDIDALALGLGDIKKVMHV
jgi:cysteine desulfurase / selenocysteine lyase